MTAHVNPDDKDLRRLFSKPLVFALVGASDKPDRPSNRVMAFLIERGYRVIPVNPGLVGKEILGQRVYAHLADVPGQVDVIDVFRASDAAYGVVAAALAEKDRLGFSVIWMQLGVVSEEAAALASSQGVRVVMDRCPKIEITRLDARPQAAKTATAPKSAKGSKAKAVTSGARKPSAAELPATKTKAARPAKTRSAPPGTTKTTVAPKPRSSAKAKPPAR